MELKVLKTFEISDELWSQIVDGFNEAFNSSVTTDDLKHGFCTQNKLGYGYHAVALSDEGEVMGFNTFSPVFYKNGLKTFFSGSVFVRKKFRGNDMLFMDMTKALRKKSIEEGYTVELGAPNANAEKFASKILKCIHITDLDYYILPLRPSKCLHKPALGSADGIFSIFARFYSSIILGIASVIKTKEKVVKYEMDTGGDFWRDRFTKPQYKDYHHGNINAYYRIYDEDGAKTAYLMDFREGERRTNKALATAVRHIIKVEDIDAILFVGILRLFQLTLLRVPSRFIPKRLPFTYHVLEKSNIDAYADMADVCNWNFSLMNFDVR